MTAQPLTLTRPAPARRMPQPPPDDTADRKKRDLEAAAAFIRSIVRALTEVDCGVRTLQSIEKWLSPEVREQAALSAQARRRLRTEHPVSTIRGIGRPRLCSPKPGVIEAAVSVALMPRTKACALRLERIRGRWIVSEYLSA